MLRNPQFAGSFYPADSTQLQACIAGYLNQIAFTGKAPKAMIVPHAGYIYSGPIAASAYARLRGIATTIRRVILMGPSHRVAFRGMAMTKATDYGTPLGDVALDTSAINDLLQLPFVQCFEQAHTHEHSLEVHLPFLQTLLPSFSLVPIVAGDAEPHEVSQILNQLWGGPETLIVVSSDLSHYHDYHTAQRLDRNTTDAIESLQYQNIDFESACGKVPVNGLLKLLQEKKLAIKNIDLRNSGDTAGDKARVVGYGAYVVE